MVERLAHLQTAGKGDEGGPIGLRDVEGCGEGGGEGVRGGLGAGLDFMDGDSGIVGALAGSRSPSFQSR